MQSLKRILSNCIIVVFSYTNDLVFISSNSSTYIDKFNVSAAKSHDNSRRWEGQSQAKW